jgi:hypothetical protein
MARVRRFTMLAAVYLLLGSVVSVAVAWGFAAQFPWTYWGVEIGDREQVSGFDQTVPAWAWKAMGSPRRQPELFARSGYTAFGVTGIEVEGWPRSVGSTPFDAEPIEPVMSDELILSQRSMFGWPVRALERVEFRYFTIPFSEPESLSQIDRWREGFPWVQDGNIAPEDAHDGWYVFDRANGAYPYPVRLPLRPLWLGMAANSMFYGAIIAALVATPGLIRRAIRAKRVRAGLCPSCRYPRGVAAVCSECGEKLSA